MVYIEPGENGLKARLGQRPSQNLSHVVAAGVVVIAADAVGVGEVGVLEAQRLHLGIHRGHAALNGAAAEVFGQQIRAVVGTGDHGSVKSVLQGDFLPLPQGDVAGIGACEGVDVLVGDRELHAVPVSLRLLAGKAQRHHLGDGRRVQFFVHILLCQHEAGVCINDAVSLRRGQGRAHRPGRQRRAEQEQRCKKCSDVFFHSINSPQIFIDKLSIPHFPLPEKTPFIHTDIAAPAVIAALPAPLPASGAAARTVP